MSDINIFATTTWRNKAKPFGIRREDRRLHMYVLGRTGMGKTTLLLNMALNDIYGGEGVCFIDPHGDAVTSLLDYIPPERVKDVIYFDPADTAHPIPLNILEQVPPDQQHLLVSGVLSIFSKMFGWTWQHRQEHIMRNVLLTLLEQKEPVSLMDVYRILVDWQYRKQAVAQVKDPIVASFWKNEFRKYAYMFRGEALAPIQNKMGAFLTAPLIRNIVGQPECRVNFRDVMDTGKILLLNLSKGRLGEDAASFLGSLIVLKLQLAAMSRVNVPEGSRKDFYLYADEFQSFVATEGIDAILSEARKYRLCLMLAHQYLGQLDERLRTAIFGNVGTIVTFPVGPENGHALETHFEPAFNRHHLVANQQHHIYLRLAVNGTTSKPFSAKTLPPFHNRRPQGMTTVVIERAQALASPVTDPPPSSHRAPRQ